MPKYNKSTTKGPPLRPENTSRIVSLGHQSKSLADPWLKLIADLSGIIDQQPKSRTKQYD